MKREVQRTGRKIRVLHLIDSGGMYGAENVIVNLSREMQASGAYEPVIGCIVAREDDAVDLINVAAGHGIEAHRIVIRNSAVLWHLPRFARIARKLRIELIHCHGYKPASFAFAVRLMTGIPAMATCHLWYVDKAAPLKMRCMIALEKSLYRFFPAVVAVSEKIREVLAGIGTDPKKIHLIKNGIVLGDYQPSAGREAVVAPEGMSIRPGEICVLNTARLTAQKGQATIVAAASFIKRSGVDLKMFIVGAGELHDELAQQIHAADVGNIVGLLGFRADVRQLLQRADIFILPSRDEGMPISLLEAVASRVPAIVTDVGDVGKLIQDGQTGLVIGVDAPEELAKAILTLVRDELARKRLAQNAWERLAQLYSSQQMFERYDAVYRSINER